MDATDPLDALDALLETEYRLLREGGFAGAAALAETKARLAETLARNRPGDPRVAALRTRAMRNEALLEAALEGQAAALRTLGTLRQAAARLDTYDSDGRPQAVGLAPGRLSRRA